MPKIIRNSLSNGKLSFLFKLAAQKYGNFIPQSSFAKVNRYILTGPRACFSKCKTGWIFRVESENFIGNLKEARFI